jgi:hypothetical protein
MRILLLLGFAMVLLGQAPPPPKVFVPKPAPEQPIPFSHKTHVDSGMKCTNCHAIKPPGDKAGIPAEALCMGCHASIKSDSPAIQKLASFAREKRAVPWVRIYKLPKTVYFSHEVHVRQAKAECATCHGPVQERAALGQEKSIFMAECMACHDQHKASNKCDLCHDTH